MTNSDGNETYDKNDYARDLFIAEHADNNYERTMAEVRAQHYSHGRDPLNPKANKEEQNELLSSLAIAVLETIGVIALVVIAIIVFTRIF